MKNKKGGIPLPEYPRPQMVRSSWLNLNGEWEYTITGKSGPEKTPKTGIINLPFAVESEASGVESPLLPDELIRYSRFVTIPESWAGNRVILHFEAVDWRCRLFINDAFAGSHEGGYLPFSFDITGLLSDSRNKIVLEAEDPTDSDLQQRGKQVLSPNTIYYTATSGIWQTVWMEAVPAANHIISFKVKSDIDSKNMILNIKTAKPCTVEAVTSLDGRVITRSTVESGTDNLIPFDEIRLWAPETPVLYGLKLSLQDDGEDRVEGYFAFRKIEVKTGRSGNKRLLLNNKPIFIHAPLDQGYWPDSGMTPPSDGAMVFDIEKMKDLGFNALRKHIKIEPRRWYYHADRLGMLVLQDAVSGGRNMAGFLRTVGTMLFDLKTSDTGPGAYRLAGRESKENRDAFEKELSGMLEHLHNHPSIIMWIPFNESWGQFDSGRIGETVEKLDPSRVVDRVSGWFDQGGGSFRSRHIYTFKLKTPPPSDRRIYFISEYGGYNLSVPGHLWNEKKKFGYRSFRSPEKLSEAYARLIRTQIIPLIKKGLGCAVYTQLCDVEIETNGLYTYDRKVLKIDAELIRTLNDEIYAEFERCEGGEHE